MLSFSIGSGELEEVKWIIGGKAFGSLIGSDWQSSFVNASLNYFKISYQFSKLEIFFF